MPSDALTAERLLAMESAPRDQMLAEIDDDAARGLIRHWRFWARPEQLPPPGDWRVWLMLAGRGFGKTRAGAEWVRGIAEGDGRARIALVGATLDDARRVMVEGASGVLAVSPEACRPIWEPSLRRLRWGNGAEATVYGSAEPEALRGPQHSHAWCDEIAKWRYGQRTWDNLAMGLRLGESPRILATTTPRPLPLLKALLAREDVVVTRGRTIDNRTHLPADFLAAMTELYAGTRLGRQELDGELIEEAEGALWSRDLIERCRVAMAPAGHRRVVIGVDPPAGAAATSDACGIVAVALGADGRGYVLADDSVQGRSPEGWSHAVAVSAARHGADRVVAEANNGGAMVESVLRAADNRMPLRLVHASRGKAARAEPVMLLYARGLVHHVGAFPELEDEMAGLLADGGYAGPGRSPDRADALVWALTALLLERGGRPGLRTF